MQDLSVIFNQIRALMVSYQPPLVARKNEPDYFDLWSEKDLVIEGRKRKEVYFAGLIIQKGYVGFYFMPVYAEPEVKVLFPPELLRLLKGKSCFHIKQLDDALLSQIEDVLRQGFEMYRRRGWV